MKGIALLVVVSFALSACKKSDESIVDDGRKPMQGKGSAGATVVSDARKAAYHEALRNVGTMETGSRASFEMETDTSGTGVGPFVHTFCPSSATPVPKTIPKAPAATKSEEWDAPTWKCLKFFLSDPTRCQYAFSSNGKNGVDAEYTATAACDPDGDGRLLRVELKGKGDATAEVKRVSLRIEGDEGMDDALAAEKAAKEKD